MGSAESMEVAARRSSARPARLGRGLPWLAAAALVLAGPSAARARDAAAARQDLPDTVLARVGADRRVTRRDFDEAWARAGFSSDSLTPAARRRFLDVLVDREVLAARARREGYAWTAPESAGWDALRDRLCLAAALDSALAATRTSLGAEGARLDAGALGVRLRDSTVARMGVRLDATLAARLAAAWARLPRPSADSSAAAQVRMLGALPVVEPGDTLRVLATSSAGDYRVHDLLAAWRALSVAYRPRVETVEQIGDLVRNGLFERALRARAAAPTWEARPEIAAALEQARDEIAIDHWMEENVYRGLAIDDATLRAVYARERDRWTVPARARVLRLSAGQRADAERTALELRDPARAESLTALARRQGLDVLAEVDAASDSALFARAWHAGEAVVLGPDREDRGWRVTRVVALLPARQRTLAEVSGPVRRLAMAEEAARRLEARCRALRREAAIRVNERSLAAMTGLAAGSP